MTANFHLKPVGTAGECNIDNNNNEVLCQYILLFSLNKRKVV